METEVTPPADLTDRLPPPGGDFERAQPSCLPRCAAPQSYTMADSRDPASDQMKQWKEQRSSQVPYVPRSPMREWAAASNGAGLPLGVLLWGCTPDHARVPAFRPRDLSTTRSRGLGLPACRTCRWQQGPSGWLRVWQLCQMGQRSQLEGDMEPPL